MPTLQEQLQAAVAQTTADSSLLHTIVHGDATTTVTTENGPVKSVAKVISENQALLTTNLSTLTAMRDLAVASATAAEDSENTAAASESAAAASASAADTSAEEAYASKTAASISEANASDSEDAAAASATAAAASETNAANSEIAAALSQTHAAASELSAGNSATIASSSAGNASSSAADAAASAAAAAGAAAGQLFSDVIDVTFGDSPFTVPANANGNLYRVDTTGGSVVIHLPSLASLAADFRLGVAKASGDVNTVEVQRAGIDTINGLTSRTVAAQYNIDTFIGDRDNKVWYASGGGLGAVNITVQRFSGNGILTTFALTGSPGSENNTNVYISGVYQQKDSYSLNGSSLIFGVAPPIGMDNIEVVFGAQAPIGVPADDTVNTVHLKNGAVTVSKLAGGTPNKLLGFNGAGAASELDPPQAFLPGMVMPYAGNTPPAGWLLCIGQAVSRATYAGLFSIIDTVYGAGDGLSTFNLPDLRGRIIAGLDNMGGVSADRLTASQADQLGGNAGAEVRTPTGTVSLSGTVGDTTLSISQLPTHDHIEKAISSGSAANQGSSNMTYYTGSTSGGSLNSTSIYATTVPLSTSLYPPITNDLKTATAGNSATHNHSFSGSGSLIANSMNITQPWLVMNFIIKT